ncbi:hypothetical protein PMAYCL1PPCAC_25200, partial [Pristionchus mayeri]
MKNTPPEYILSHTALQVIMRTTPPDGFIRFTIDKVSEIGWNKHIMEAHEVVVKGLRWVSARISPLR